jgi:hypothetical protein
MSAKASIKNVVETPWQQYVPHSICNNGLTDLTFIVVRTPVEDN